MNVLAQSNPWEGVDIGRDLALFSPMLALIATMLAVVACPVIVGRNTRTIAGVSILGVVVALLLLIFRVTGLVADGGESGLSTSPESGILIADNLSAWFQIVLLVFVLAVTGLWWMGSAEREENAPEFFILLLGSALGMTLMVSTTNLLMIVIAIEMASLPSYTLVGFDKRDPIGAEASLKYMVFGAISVAVMLYGASLLYGLAGSLNVSEIARFTVLQLSGDGSVLVLATGLICFMGGIAFKISAVPFHFWCPDAFQGAKIEVTTWLSVVSKAAGLLLLSRLVLAFSDQVLDPNGMSMLAPLWWSIGMVAAVTCTLGNFAAYRQTSVKRLLAYSSIAHAGYMMMAAAVFLHPSSEMYYSGTSALLFYILIYMFMNLGAFGVTAMVSWQTGSDDIGAFTGLIRRAPGLAIPMVICLMSLVGLPPFAGFLAKFWVLLALGQMDNPLGWILVIVAVVNTLISLYYYMRLVVQMTLRDDDSPEISAPLGGVAMVNLCAVLLLVLFIFGRPVKQAADRFAQDLYSPASASQVAASQPPAQ